MGGIMGEAALAEYMKAKSNGSAATIHLAGMTPGNNNAHGLGTYTKSGKMNAGRHVFQQRSGSNSLWFAESGAEDKWGNRLPGSWYVGPSAMIGNRQGFFKVTQNTDIPEEISAMWQVYYDGALHDAPKVIVLTPTQHARELQASLSGASRQVAMTGRMPHGLDCFSAFGFSKLTQALSSSSPVAQMVNDRFTYLSDDGAISLWYVGAPPTWLIGSTADIGGRAGFMIVEDSALVPERITATWMVFDNGTWGAVPGFKIAAQENEMAT